jgi:hypothetical protein
LAGHRPVIADNPPLGDDPGGTDPDESTAGTAAAIRRDRLV